MGRKIIISFADFAKSKIIESYKILKTIDTANIGGDGQLKTNAYVQVFKSVADAIPGKINPIIGFSLIKIPITPGTDAIRYKGKFAVHVSCISTQDADLSNISVPYLLDMEKIQQFYHISADSEIDEIVPMQHKGGDNFLYVNVFNNVSTTIEFLGI